MIWFDSKKWTLIGLHRSQRAVTSLSAQNAIWMKFGNCVADIFIIKHTRAQSYQLESIQKRAVHITFSDTRGMSYPNVLFVANLNSLKDRRDRLSWSFFCNICKPHLSFLDWESETAAMLFSGAGYKYTYLLHLQLAWDQPASTHGSYSGTVSDLIWQH